MERHGKTRGCPGCDSWFKGVGRRPHTDVCRQRFRDLMQGEAKVVASEARRAEFAEREMDKRARREERRDKRRADVAPEAVASEGG